MAKLTLITPTQGNPIALKRTLDSFKDVVDEVILGDVIIFQEDRDIIDGYKSEYNLKVIPLPFNFIFSFGFSATLNLLASHAKNDMVVYMNVSEVIAEEHRILQLIEHFNQYNTFAFDHATDPHTWFRTYNRKELQWSGVIHEDLVGERRPAPFYLFRMADTEKDMADPFKARVYDFCKECVYFNNYMKIVDNPDLLGATNPGWIQFAKESYQSFKDRLSNKGAFYTAFKDGNFDMLLEYIYTNPEFHEERLKSSLLIEYQIDKQFLL